MLDMILASVLSFACGIFLSNAYTNEMNGNVPAKIWWLVFFSAVATYLVIKIGGLR